IGAIEPGLGVRKRFGQVPAHADDLGALPGEQQSGFAHIQKLMKARASNGSPRLAANDRAVGSSIKAKRCISPSPPAQGGEGRGEEEISGCPSLRLSPRSSLAGREGSSARSPARGSCEVASEIS